MGKVKKSDVIDWVKTFAYPIIVAFLILLIIRPTVVREYSMYPTINEDDYVIVFKLAYLLGEPEYGDIIVFESDLKLDETHNKYLIKRIIATEGDTIEVSDGVVYLNGEALEEDYINGDTTTGLVEEMIVPEGQVFVMGDNRPSSVDSRDPSVGLVDEDRIMGKVILRLYPFDQIGSVY